MSKIVPAILTNDEEIYVQQLRKAEHASDLIQIDIIDGKFANNTTIGVKTVQKFLSSSNLEIHLMANSPDTWIDELAKIEYVSRIIISYEADRGVREAIYKIKNYNKQVGLSLNPDTPLGAALGFVDEIDLFLFLSVMPGFSGQKFQDVVYQKAIESKKKFPGLALEVDGGVNFENAAKLKAVGFDFIAANSVIFKADDFHVAYEKLSKVVS